MRVLGLGNALVDVLTKLESDDFLHQLNLLKGGMQLIDTARRSDILTCIASFEQKQTAGGSASNTLSALAQMGIKSGFIGKIGDDDFGKLYKHDMIKMGVKPHFVETLGQASGTAMALISPDGERTFGTYLGASATLSKENLQAEVFAQYNYLYVEGYLVQNYELIEAAMHMAKSLGMQVAIDAASYNVVEDNRDFFLYLIENYVDILFANEEEAKALGASSVEEALPLLREKVDTVVVKLGAQGAIACRGQDCVRVPALPARLVDATAAGDYFAAGFLYGMSISQNLDLCARLGALFASQVIEVIGTRLEDKNWEHIKETTEKILSSSITN